MGVVKIGCHLFSGRKGRLNTPGGTTADHSEDTVENNVSKRCFERDRVTVVPPVKQRTEELGTHVLSVAMGMLEAGDVAITTRSVAAAADTSTAALYELFGDKAGLLGALAAEGFRLLLSELDAETTTDDPRADLLSGLGATRRFALQHPMLFEVMFSRPAAEFGFGAIDPDLTGAIYRSVMRRVDRCIRAGIVAGNRVDIAQVLIATNRGLIAAQLAGILGNSTATADRRWNLAMNTLISGFAP
jgi:AcrR family transcriptional regulator